MTNSPNEVTEAEVDAKGRAAARAAYIATQNYPIVPANHNEALDAAIRAYLNSLAPASTTLATRPVDAGSERALETAARDLVAHKFSTYKAKNGREVGVEADDGEKCYIVHSDYVFALERALSLSPTVPPGEPEPGDGALNGKYGEFLIPFVAMMNTELHANNGKGDRPGWLAMSRQDVLLEIYHHLAKLQKAALKDEAPGIREFAADVANMSMMLVDVCGLLCAPPSIKEVPMAVDAKGLEAMKEAIYGRHERGFIMEPLIGKLDFAKGIEAYLTAVPSPVAGAVADLVGRLRDRRFPGKWSDTVVKDPLCIEAASALEALTSQVAALEKRVAVAVEVLRPFAEAMTRYEAIWAERTGNQEHANGEDDEFVQFLGWLGDYIDFAKVGDFRRARDFLSRDRSGSDMSARADRLEAELAAAWDEFGGAQRHPTLAEHIKASLDELAGIASQERSAREKAEAELAAVRGALERSMVALDDWLVTYASEFANETSVAEAAKRISEFGTVSYIAEVQAQNRSALATGKIE